MSAREPQITILCCRYCGHIPMELAGIERAQYPASVKVVELPCTGGVSVLHLLKALEGGADGVLVTSCPDGNCHHLSGNKRATLRSLRRETSSKRQAWRRRGSGSCRSESDTPRRLPASFAT